MRLRFHGVWRVVKGGGTSSAEALWLSTALALSHSGTAHRMLDRRFHLTLSGGDEISALAGVADGAVDE
jgi:hypothetical protein